MGQTPAQCSWDLAAFAAAADGLAAHPPYRVPLSCLQVVFHYGSVADKHVLQALNGAVVALTKPAEKLQSRGSASNQTAACAAVTVCLGIGVVRSVDPAQQQLYILSPTSLDELQQAVYLEVRAIHLSMALLVLAWSCADSMTWCSKVAGAVRMSVLV